MRGESPFPSPMNESRGVFFELFINSMKCHCMPSDVLWVFDWTTMLAYITKGSSMSVFHFPVDMKCDKTAR